MTSNSLCLACIEWAWAAYLGIHGLEFIWLISLIIEWNDQLDDPNYLVCEPMWEVQRPALYDIRVFLALAAKTTTLKT